jgi:calcineurin-like phosphoesterase family protein
MAQISRRTFLKDTAILTTVLSVPLPSCKPPQAAVAFGMIADVHQDLIPDGMERLQTFISDSKTRKLDFIIQMGDFCIPKPENHDFLNIYNSYAGEKHHVLGNHDMDGGFTRKDAMEFWKMKAKYYSFDKNEIHFVILDGNDPNPKPFEGYDRFIGPQQMEWLRNDLRQTKFPVIIFSHQTLENEDGGIANMSKVREMLEEINESAGYTKVMACLCGHHHTDFHTRIKDIYYIQINSASYRWVGGDYKVKRFSQQIHEKYQWLEYTIPYKDPLYTFITMNPKGELIIESKKSIFVGPGPEEMGMPKPPKNDPIVPFITGKELKLS